MKNRNILKSYKNINRVPRGLSRFLKICMNISHLDIILRDLFKVDNAIHSDIIHLQATMYWLCRAQDATNCGGVSAYYSLDEGWAPPYPETTGYIIPTFLRYGLKYLDGNYINRALRMGDWEIEIQLPSGAVRGGLGLNEYPIVFNTGQVIFGWCSLYNETKTAKYLHAAERAADWLVDIQDEDGKWHKHTYMGIPTVYHARVAWSLIEIYKITHNKKYLTAAEKNIAWILTNSTENGWFNKMAFTPNGLPLTHAVAYTLEGLIGSSLYLLDENNKKKALNAVEIALRSIIIKYELVENSRFLPATMDENWESKDNYSCITGNAQLSWVLLELYKISKDTIFLQAALNLIDLVKTRQRLDCKNMGIKGGIPGSYPIWGNYARLAYTNWSAKYFADAIISKEEVIGSKD